MQNLLARTMLIVRHVNGRGHEDGGQIQSPTDCGRRLEATWPIVRDEVGISNRRGSNYPMHPPRVGAYGLHRTSAGVGVAVALSEEFASLKGMKRVGVVLCGGSIDQMLRCHGRAIIGDPTAFNIIL